MPDATITSTASTFGTISGTFAADQSTVTGTISGTVTGTLTGSVGVPGPAGPGVPAGGTAGQYLQKIDGVDYNTDWVTLNLSAYAPINSPVFTGDPQAPTPAFGDNDTSIATTAFVQAGLLGGTANARNLEVYVRNQSGSTIPAGSIVYISGATGNRPLITLAQANNDANSAQTMGFTKTSIANNGFGYVIVRGELENIDTSALTEGAQLYLSPTTAGTWTTTKPSAPQHLVYVGIVVRAHPTLGVILVAVQNGYELNELHDVAITSPTNGQVLKYNSSTNLWVNGTDSSGVAWGGITGTLSAQGDLASALAAKYDASNPSGYITSSALTGYATESWVTAGFYPLTGNPSGFLTSASLTGYATESWVYALGYLTDAPSDGNQYVRLNGSWSTLSVPADYITSVSSPLSVTAGDLSIDLSAYAPIASPALTGNVTITTNSTSPALFIEQAGTGNILTLHDQVSDTTFVAIDQAGKIGTIASTTTNAGFNVPHGTAPTTPVNGDVWTTTSGLFTRINGGTQQYAPLGSNNTFSNASSTYGSSTATGTIGLATGATISGSTKTVNIGTGGVSGSTTNVNIANNIGGPSGVSTINIGTSTPASTVNLNGTVNAATATAGTSTTQIATTAFVTTADNLKANLASPTFTGTPAAPTAAADTNTTQLATTAFVVGQAGSATPLVDGTAAVGTSLRYARQDHVHPIDTSRAALASPTFTGVPAAPTAAVDTNTTQIATTAFVVAQAASATPLVDGTAAVGTSLRYARADHVHPTDTTLAPLASPTFTGTPTLPTGTIAVTQSTGNNTTAVATTAFVQQEVPAASTTAAGKIELATVDEALRPASSTLGMTPETTREMLMYPGYINLFGGGNVATSGTGAASTFTFATQRWHAMRSPNATIAGYGMYIFDYSFSGIGMAAMTRGVSSHARKWNNRIWVSGRTVLGQFAETTSGLNGDANCTARVMLGGRSSAGTGGMVSSDPGIGWRVAGGGSVALVMTVSNGTTLTETTSSFTPVLGQVFDWKMYSDGTGNVTLWVNDSQVATSTGGPTTSTAENYNFYCEVVEQTASATTPFSMGNFGSKVFWSQA